LKRLPQASTSLLHPTTSAQNSTTDSTPIQTKLPLHPASTVKREPVARMSGRPSVFTSQVCIQQQQLHLFLLDSLRRRYLCAAWSPAPHRHNQTIASILAHSFQLSLSVLFVRCSIMSASANDPLGLYFRSESLLSLLTAKTDSSPQITSGKLQ